MVEFILLVILGTAVTSFDSVIGSGGLVFVSAFNLLGIPIIPAIATMRLLSLVQEGVSAVAFFRKKLLSPQPMLWYGLWAAGGGLIGSMLLLNFTPTYLPQIIGVCMALLYFIIPRLQFKDMVDITNPFLFTVQWIKERILFRRTTHLHLHWNKSMLNLTTACFLLSIYGGFYGAGFGTVALFPFMFIGKMGFLRSAAYARVIGFCMLLTASWVFLQESVINWQLFVPLSIGVVIGSFIGVELATRINLQYLKIALMFIIAITSIRLIAF